MVDVLHQRGVKHVVDAHHEHLVVARDDVLADDALQCERGARDRVHVRRVGSVHLLGRRASPAREREQIRDTLCELPREVRAEVAPVVELLLRVLARVRAPLAACQLRLCVRII